MWKGKRPVWIETPSMQRRQVIRRDRLHRTISPLSVLPSRDQDLLLLARVAERVDGVVLGLQHPEQARARLSVGPASTLHQRFADVAFRERAAVLDQPGDAENLPSKSGMWIAVVVEPVPDVDDEGHVEFVAQP